MRFSLYIASALPIAIALLAGCAHGAPPPPRPVSTTTTTSSQVTSAIRLIPSAVVVPLAGEVPSLDQWAERYPDAAQELGQWIASHRETARALAQWQELHPEQMEALVDWSITHPSGSLGELLFDRSGWGGLRMVVGNDDEAQGFMPWIRHAPHAAREVALYSNGLAFLDERVDTLLASNRAQASMRRKASIASGLR